jgi:hypothetical protein
MRRSSQGQEYEMRLFNLSMTGAALFIAAAILSAGAASATPLGAAAGSNGLVAAFDENAPIVAVQFRPGNRGFAGRGGGGPRVGVAPAGGRMVGARGGGPNRVIGGRMGPGRVVGVPVRPGPRYVGRGWRGSGAAVGVGIAAGIAGEMIAAEAERAAAAAEDAAVYCASRYRSYDPSTGTYIARNGRRLPCP